MQRCGPFDVVIDARGVVLEVGPRLALLTGRAQGELAGKPLSLWLRGALVAAPGILPGPLELCPDARPPVPGFGIRSTDEGRTTITFVPAPARSESSRSGGDRSDNETRAHEIGREIQDALTGIIGFAGLMPVAPTPHRRKFYLDQVVSQAERVRRLVQAQEPVGRSPGGARPHKQAQAPLILPADLGHELSRSLSGLRSSLERSGIGFDIELGPEPVWASCDARQVGDFVTALIQRATVQQRRDFQANEVVLQVRPPAGSGGMASVQITLTGADQPHVLLRERFGTGDADGAASTSEAELRAGLFGLQRQGGRFTLAQDPAREEVRLTLALPIAAAPRRADKLRTPVPLEILVVDDDPMLGELYQEMLQVAGHSVTACSSMFAAREALRAQRFDAVVAEFQLKDGLLSELWATASEAHPELASRLIVATRDARDARLVEWTSQQKTPVLAKPFAAPALMEQLALLV